MFQIIDLAACVWGRIYLINQRHYGIGAWRSPVSALVWETRGRRFKSSRSDHLGKPPFCVTLHILRSLPCVVAASIAFSFNPVPAGNGGSGRHSVLCKGGAEAREMADSHGSPSH